MLKRILLLSLFAVSAHAQNGGFTWQDAANGDPVPAGTGGTGGTTNLGPGLTTFADLASFQAAAPAAINTEDLEDNNAGGAFASCPTPINSTGDGVCFTAGQFVDGLDVNTSSGGDAVLLPANFVAGLTSAVLGAITFTDTTFLDFTGGDTQAVGMEVYAGLAAGDVLLTVFDTGGGMLGTINLAGIGALPDNVFIGIVADAPIGQIVIDGLGGNGELFDNLLFGPVVDLPPPPAVPTLQSTGLLILVLLLAGGSVLLLARRRNTSN